MKYYEIYEIKIRSFWDDIEDILEEGDHIDRPDDVSKRVECGIIAAESAEDAVKNWHNAEVMSNKEMVFEIRPAKNGDGVIFVRNEYILDCYGDERHKKYFRTCYVWANEII